jgi:hypothetical protein
MPIKTSRVDIYQLPNADMKPEAGEAISVGDLHGNAIKLLFVLFKHGIASGLNEFEYIALKHIYLTPVQSLTIEDLNTFDALLNRIQWNNQNMIRLIGDEMADRGKNDYFTLKILEKMSKNKVPYEILFSNHGLEFIKAYEQDSLLRYSSQLAPGQARSLQNLQRLVHGKKITTPEVRGIIDEAYKPHLKLISYALDPDPTNPKLTIFTHAPLGLDQIKGIAKLFNIKYEDNNIHQMTQTLDRINQAFQEQHVMPQSINVKTRDNEQSELFNFAWNREYRGLQRPERHHNYCLHFAHGHDSAQKHVKRTNIHQLDNELGKYDQDGPIGQYDALFTMESNLFKNLLLQVNKLGEMVQLEQGPDTDVARELHQDLEEAISSHQKNPNPAQLSEKCEKALATAKPTLDNSPTWSQIFKDITVAVLSLGIIHTIHFAITGTWSLFHQPKHSEGEHPTPLNIPGPKK